MAIDGLHLPRLGVYAVMVDVLTGPHRGSYDGVASLGVRPMFGENAPNLEIHLFDFDGDLYGAHLSVALVEYLRPEMKFDGLPGAGRADGGRLRPGAGDPAALDPDAGRRARTSHPILRAAPLPFPAGLGHSGRHEADSATPRARFLGHRPLSKMTPREWEALCDGCGKCCLNKLEDEDTGEVAFTRDRLPAARRRRPAAAATTRSASSFVPECVVLTPKSIDAVAHWMPATCAYRLLHEGRPLPDWHPLISGDPESVHRAGQSVRGLDHPRIRGRRGRLGRPYHRGA